MHTQAAKKGSETMGIAGHLGSQCHHAFAPTMLALLAGSSLQLAEALVSPEFAMFVFISTSFRSFSLSFVFRFSLTKQTLANKLLLSSVATGVVVSGGGMSTKSVGGSDGSDVEAGAFGRKLSG